MKEKKTLFLVLLVAFVLRFFGEGISPPGFNADEASFGYSAYSILKTGRDEYGNFLPLTLFSFGDYKAALYAYLSIPVIIIFGLNEFSVRFMARLFGTLSVLLIYKFSLKIFKNKKISLLSAFFLAVSPWHLLQSRVALESTVSLFFTLLGLYLFVSWREKQKLIILIFATLAFSFTFYSYSSGKLTTPLIAIGLLIFYWRDFLRKKTQLFLCASLAFFLLLPLLFLLITSKGRIVNRAKYISIFNNPQLALNLWEAKTIDGPQANTYVTRFLHNKPKIYFLDFLKRYFQHFNLNFLFLTGDPHERFKTPFSGLLSWVFIPLIFYGVYQVLKNKNQKKEKLFLLYWLAISPIVSSFAVLTPNSLHMLDAVIPFNLILAFGVSSLKRGALFTFWLLFSLSFFEFLYGYFYYLPNNYQNARTWSYGYKELVKKVTAIEKDYHSINFYGGHVSPFLLFYQKYDPLVFQKEYNLSPANSEGFQLINSFGKYYFNQEFKIEEISKDNLYISFEDKIPESFLELFQEIGKVTFINGEVAFRILKPK